jgi:hypothetical protein
VSTAPKLKSAKKMKPAKPAGKQKTLSQTVPIGTAFPQVLRALGEQYLGPPDGAPGEIGKLVDETSQLSARSVCGSFTHKCLSEFLRVTALNEEAREVGSNVAPCGETNS